MKVTYSWLKDYLGDDLPPVDEVVDLLTFHAFEIDGVEEVGKDVVIDIDVLPNRASDCLSVRGIARELATILNIELKKDPLKEDISMSNSDEVSVQVSDEKACRRFTASVIKNVKVKESPKWLQDRLRAIGQRPINNIVDATNYIMFTLGQPMHAYDADLFPKVDGKWRVGVRLARAGEEVGLLAESGKDEERVVELKGEELLIVEGSGDKPVGLAGIKGGKFAELHTHTKNIILEAASFDPALIRKTARRLGILTDASKRFENEPASELPIYAQKMIVKLIEEIADGEVAGVVDIYPQKAEQIVTTVTVDRVNRILGLSLAVSEIREIIARTGAEVTEETAEKMKVVAPWERNDLKIEEDYIEEVGRIYGLTNIVSVEPEKMTLPEVNINQYYNEKVRQALLMAGYSEVITSSFQKKDQIQLQNSLASDKSCLRSSLRKNITTVLDNNFTHGDLLGLFGVRVFEIGTVFTKVESGVGEKTLLCLGARTKGNGYHAKDDIVLQEGIKAVEEKMGTKLEWEIEKGVAECDIGTAVTGLVKPEAYDAFVRPNPVTYHSVSAYPSISRDIALWIDGNVPVEKVADSLTAVAGRLLVRQTLFDTFQRDDRTSYAFRLVFQSMTETLTDIQINKIMDKIYDMAKANGWEVR